LEVGPHKWPADDNWADDNWVDDNWVDVVCPVVLGLEWLLEAVGEPHWPVCGLLLEGARRRVWCAVQDQQLDVAGAILVHGDLLAARFVPRWDAVPVVAIT